MLLIYQEHFPAVHLRDTNDLFRGDPKVFAERRPVSVHVLAAEAARSGGERVARRDVRQRA